MTSVRDHLVAAAAPPSIAARERVQRELFARATRRPDRSSLHDVARSISATPAFAPFRVWVVGSILSAADYARDIDLLLTRRDLTALSVSQVEDALVAARRAGLRHGDVSVDCCFRNSLFDRLGGILLPGTRLVTWKLENPHQSLVIRMGLFGHHRRVGRATLVFRRRAKSTNYFEKLETIEGMTKQDARILAPAKPVSEFL